MEPLLTEWTSRAVLTAVAACLLVACGGRVGDSSHASANASARKALADGKSAPELVSCAEMVNMQIPATAMQLPTRGGVVTATQSVAASGTGAGAIGEYCLVSGKIMPVDPAAPSIEFQLGLPADWNTKILMLGGSGFDGSVPSVTSNVANGPTNSPVPLGRGYAVLASDSGHESANGSLDGSFSVNAEAYRNFMGDALKKAHDAALLLVRAAYGRKPTRAYFSGGSTGGREALVAAQRWPADWDGIVALYPAWDFTALTLAQLNATEAFAVPGAYLNTAKRGVLFSAALAACDGLDGASDGVISNVQGCYSEFDPATAAPNGTPLRCPDGADTGDTCLSDVQLAALQRMNSPLAFGFPLASGETSYPGYNIFIADTGITSTSPLEPVVSLFALGSAPPAFPFTSNMMVDGQVADSFVRYTVTGSPGFDSLRFDIGNPGAFASRLSALSALDASDPNLSAFAARGGKLLIAHGTADLTVSTRATEHYYQRMQATMGAANVDKFVRFYEVPGLQHVVSSVFNATWDQLTALESWVEKGVDPVAGQIVTDTAGVPGRTRPLCVYPSWPRYNGSGDLNSASSFSCAIG